MFRVSVRLGLKTVKVLSILGLRLLGLGVLGLGLLYSVKLRFKLGLLYSVKTIDV